MAIKENRKRSVQLHFRLTPDENALFQKQIQESGMTMSEYLIKLLINRVGLSAVNCHRKLSENGMKLDFVIGNHSIGYAKCSYDQEKNMVSIRSLYVIERWRGQGIEDQLLQEIEDYAVLKGASSIVSYPGPEPFCPGGWLPLNDEIALYKAHGYKQMRIVAGDILRMEKRL